MYGGETGHLGGRGGDVGLAAGVIQGGQHAKLDALPHRVALVRESTPPEDFVTAP